MEDRHRRRIDDPQPHPLARIEERGPIVARTVAIDEEAVGRAVDIGDVGRVHPHRAPRKTVLQRLILAGEQQIGRASCRERVCQYVELSEVAVSLKIKNTLKLYMASSESNKRNTHH